MPTVELPDWVQVLIEEVCTVTEPDDLARYVTALIVIDHEKRRGPVGSPGAHSAGPRLKALLARGERLSGVVVPSNWTWETVRSHPHEFLDWLTEVGRPVLVMADGTRGFIVQSADVFRETARWVELAKHYLTYL